MMPSVDPSQCPGWQQRGKRLLAHPLCAILLCGAITGLGHALLLADWDPFQSADTKGAYGPTLTILNQPQWDYRELFIKPFFRSARDNVPRAEEAKPVFVCALRLWHMGWKRWVQPKVVFPDPHAYAAFVIATCVLAFLSLYALGWKLGNPWVGTLTGLAVLWCPWGLSACYFTTYTAFSLTLFCAAILLLLCRPTIAFLAGGILVSLSLLSNQSLLACTPALPLLILFRKGEEGRWGMGKALAAFALGMALPYTAGEILGATGWVKALVGGAPIQKPLAILELYLARSRTERLEYLPAQHHSFFLLLNCLNSWVLTAVGAGIILIFFGSVLRWTVQGKIAGLLKKFADPHIRNSLLILTPGLAALLVIDGRTGFKFSRSYFLAMPFLVMGLFDLGLCLVRNLPGRFVRIGVACLVLLGCAEESLRIRDFYQAFQGAAKALRPLVNQPGRVVALQQDIHWWYLSNMGITMIDASQPIPDQVSYLVTGPDVPSALVGHTVEQIEIADYVRRHSLRLALDRKLPFFALYPFLVYEDPAATFALEILHRFDRQAYRDGPGTVKIWRLLR